MIQLKKKTCVGVASGNAFKFAKLVYNLLVICKQIKLVSFFFFLITALFLAGFYSVIISKQATLFYSFSVKILDEYVESIYLFFL